MTNRDATHSSSASYSDASAHMELIKQHIRQIWSSHFRPITMREDGVAKGELAPIQEMESPPPKGCCGKGGCAVM